MKIEDVIQIYDFNNYYITRQGEVLSSKRGKVKILKKELNTNGYYRVTLVDEEGNKHRRYIHRLVASAFCRKDTDKPCVNHIDGNKRNNNACNLEWCTHKENMIHAIDNGLWNPKEAGLKGNISQGKVCL